MRVLYLSRVCVVGVARRLILLGLHLQDPLRYLRSRDPAKDHDTNHTHDMPALISCASMALLLLLLRHSAHQPHAFSPASSAKQVRCFGRQVPKGLKRGPACADPTPAAAFDPQTNSSTLPATSGCSGARQASVLLSMHTPCHEVLLCRNFTRQNMLSNIHAPIGKKVLPAVLLSPQRAYAISASQVSLVFIRSSCSKKSIAPHLFSGARMIGLMLETIDSSSCTPASGRSRLAAPAAGMSSARRRLAWVIRQIKVHPYRIRDGILWL